MSLIQRVARGLDLLSGGECNMARTLTGRGHAIGGGAIAGVLAGIALALALVAMAVATGHDVWLSLKGAGAPVFPDRAQAPGFDAAAVALGVAGHFAISIVWGIVFAAIFYGLSRTGTIFAGILWGFVVWLAMYYAVLPAFGLAEHASTTPVADAVLLHVLFGFVLAVGFLPYQRNTVIATRTVAPTTVAPSST
jgi:hypothetical protein